MAIIQSCCCCGWSLRKGCYASACFSLIYFFLFTWITGSMTIGKLQPLFYSEDEFEGSSHIHHHHHHSFENAYGGDNVDYQAENNSHVGQSSSQQKRRGEQRVAGKISPFTLASSWSYEEEGNESGLLETNSTRKVSASSSAQEKYDNDFQAEYDRENNSISMLRLFLFSDAYAMVQTVNLVLDLVCEVTGVYASILLIRGLQQEKKSMFWPWMIVVPTHIAIDAITMGGIMMEFFLEPNEQTPLSLVLMTVFVDVTLNSINAYGLICVISQYQEYKAGRGTAAYEEFTSQTPTILLETASSTKTVLNKPNVIPPQARRKSTKDYSTSSRVYNSKSDTCCEEFSMQTLSTANDKQSLADNHIVRATKNRGVHHTTVKNGQATIITLDDESQPQAGAPSINNNGNNPRRGSKGILVNGSGKFGKYLDVSQKRKQANLTSIEVDDCSSDLNDADKITPVPNNYKSISWNREQLYLNDSDSEDPTVDALSAFGILGK